MSSECGFEVRWDNQNSRVFTLSRDVTQERVDTVLVIVAH